MGNTEAPHERVLDSRDIPGGLALVAEAGWNQVEADWRIFLELGRCYGIESDEAGVVATAATLPYGGAFGWISMVLVRGTHRGRGIATRLLRRCIDSLTERGATPVLDATPAGRRVYLQLGFRDAWGMQRWHLRERNAWSGDEAARVERVRALRDDDWPQLCAQDRMVFGADRSVLLSRLRQRSSAFAAVAERDGRLSGYLLGRDGRSATQIGPVIADDEPTAMALVAHALVRIGTPVYIDAADRFARLSEWLQRGGFVMQRPFTRMVLGRDTAFGLPERVAAIAGPELG